MSGHSKWSTIKRKKGAKDARRSKVFSKLIKEITVAARLGGGDAEANPRLRLAVSRARDANMPADNIKRAIQKGTGELEGVHYEEVVYEAFGPGGVALLIEALTDNRNRTVSDLRHVLDRKGGKLGASGSVAHLFTMMGYIAVERRDLDEDTLMTAAIEAGAEDVRTEGDIYEVLTHPGDLESVAKSLESAGVACESAEISRIPSTTVKLEGKPAQTMLQLMDALEDVDDVQKIYANFDISEAEMARAE
ncbi:MAG: YebC/PmpR family DNA-binding transcriptional regulator [Candidatus Krumholzibacteriia bacterium]